MPTASVTRNVVQATTPKNRVEVKVLNYSDVNAKQAKVSVTIGGSSNDINISNYANASLAIQAGIDLAVSQNKNHAFIDGNVGDIYIVGDASILIPSNFTLEAKKGVTLKIKNNSSGTNPVAFRNSDQTNGNVNITLKNITGDGNGVNQVAGQSRGGVYLNFVGVENLIYDDVRIENSVRYNSFIGTVTSGSLTGTITFTKDTKTITGVGTSFTTQLVVGQRIRSGTGNLSFPIARIISNTSLVLAENWVYNTETNSASCAKVNGVKIKVKNSYFGKTEEDDSFGGGGWDNSLIDNLEIENSAGYGFGCTSMFSSDINNLQVQNCQNGWGLERVAQCRFNGGYANYSASKGINVINGSHNNEFVNVIARGNQDGVYDACTSILRGYNSKNKYIGVKAFENQLNGFNFSGSLKPHLVGCEAYNNNLSNSGTAHGILCQAGSGYNTVNPRIESTRGWDDQIVATQTRDIYLDTGCIDAEVDFTGFANISGVNAPNRTQNLKILNGGKTINIISSTARKINNYETLIYCNQDTYTHELPRIDSIVDGHKIKFIHNGSGTPNWSFIRSASDAFGTVESISSYPQSTGFWVEYYWDDASNFWRVSGISSESNNTKFNLPTHPDNTSAISGGLSVGDIYKTATGELRIRI